MERSPENSHGTLENHFLVTTQSHHINLANVIIYPIAARLVRILVPAIPVDFRISGSINLFTPPVEDLHVQMIDR